MKDKFYEKYAWVIFLAIGILILVGGVPHAFGINTDPTLVEIIGGLTVDELRNTNPMFFNLYNYYFSGGGLSDVGVAFFIIIISTTAFRQRQKWAWYAFWFIPVFFGSWIVLSSALPLEAQSLLYTPLIVFFTLSVVGLLLPFRKFFPKKI